MTQCMSFRTPSQESRWTLFPPAAALAVALGLSGCASEATAATAVPGAFAVARPTIGATVERPYVAQVQAVRHVELRARVRGAIETVSVDEGSTVAAGQLLFSINARAAQQQLEGAKAVVESAVAELAATELELHNTRGLVEKNIVSEAELALATARAAVLAARVKEAEAAREQAAFQLTQAQVRAPFAGVLGRLPKKAGSVVAEDELLTTLTDTSEVFAYFRVSEVEYLRHRASAGDEAARRVSFVLADGSPLPTEGVIDAVDSAFDDDAGTIAFRARFKNEGGILKQGATGKVVLRDQLQDALVIPQRATFEVQENVFVFTVDSANTVHATRVTPRFRVNDTFVLEGGLGPDDRIVLDGAQRLQDGMKISIQSGT